MKKQSDTERSHNGRMKIGYVASHAYRLTFEINEIIEIVRQQPDTRVYSFYRAKGPGIQRKRLSDVPGTILSWSYGTIVRSFFYFLFRDPIGLTRSGLKLMWCSRSNPIYWVKNLVVFFVALPMLCDARRHGVTHLHADFGSSPATIAWLGKELLGTGFSIRYHSFDIHLNTLRFKDPLRRRKLRDADLVVAVHHDGLGHLKRKVPDVPEDKFKMIRISVVFAPEAKPDALPQPPLVLGAGNLVPAKGFDVLVRAVAVLKRRGVHVRLRILGEGGERAHLSALVREGRIGDRTEMPGYFQHGEFSRHLAGALALVIPARITRKGVREGLPTVIAEAWLSRTPVIASPVGGIPEVVKDGDTGLIFPTEDAEALADCIGRLSESNELRATLARNGYRKACESFSPENNVRKLLEEIRILGRC